MSLVKTILDKTTLLREKHEKRSDARKFSDEYENLMSLPSDSGCYKVSLGYLERFLIMADHKKISDSLEKGILQIKRWDEGCGYFSGEYSILNGVEKLKSGSFEWSGSGTIENSWDSFSKFE